MPTIKERLGALANQVQWNWSSCVPWQEEVFRQLLSRIPGDPATRRIVEIGTHNGVSAALLAEYGIVATIDVLPNPLRMPIWEHLGLVNRITSYVFKSQDQRDDRIIEECKYATLAFIDGGHLMGDVEYDFDLTNECPIRIFHDYWQDETDWPDVHKFVDNLDPKEFEIVIAHPFAMVTRR